MPPSSARYTVTIPRETDALIVVVLLGTHLGTLRSGPSRGGVFNSNYHRLKEKTRQVPQIQAGKTLRAGAPDAQADLKGRKCASRGRTDQSAAQPRQRERRS